MIHTTSVDSNDGHGANTDPDAVSQIDKDLTSLENSTSTAAPACPESDDDHSRPS